MGSRAGSVLPSCRRPYSRVSPQLLTNSGSWCLHQSINTRTHNLVPTVTAVVNTHPQLVASVCALLVTSASLVHAVERLPWHDALYFVTTTLTTVGYGDVVVRSMAGEGPDVRRIQRRYHLAR